MVAIGIQIKKSFFDRQALIERIGKQNARRFSRMGAFIQRRAQTDVLRRAPGGGRGRKGSTSRRSSARPGRPPYVHMPGRSSGLRHILFGLGEDEQSVAVGPLRHNKKLRGSNRQTIPELLTFGGTATIQESSFDNQTWIPGNFIQAPYHRQRQATYAPHPFMSVALQKEIAAGSAERIWSS